MGEVDNLNASFICCTFILANETPVVFVSKSNSYTRFLFLKQNQKLLIFPQ